MLKIMFAVIQNKTVIQCNRWAQFLCSHGSIERENGHVILKVKNKTECTLFMIDQARLAPDPNTIITNPGTITR